jgi:predicted dehydrogenase
VLKVAIVGAGQIAEQHLRVWQKLEDTEVTAVCDLNAGSANRLAARANARPYTDMQVLLRDEPTDVIDICTPPQTHVPLALAAMDAGRNVLLEKPMAMDSAGAAELVEKQRSSGVQLGVMHNWLFGPVVWRAWEMVRRGEIGDVLTVNIQMVDSDDDEMIADAGHWCHSLPGGRFGECLIHAVYLVQAFSGPTRVEKVISSKRGRYSWVQADEMQALLAGDRATGHIYASFNAPRKMVIVEIIGARGILRADMISHSLVKLGPRRDARLIKLLDNARQAAQLVESSARSALHFARGGSLSGHPLYMRLFAEALRSGRPLPVSPEQAYSAVKTLEEICRQIDAHTLEPAAAT